MHAALLSSIGFFGYNLLSLFVLLLLNAVAHSVCNTCRRAVTILTTAAFFSTVISPSSGLGLSLSIGGAAAYAFYSSPARKKADEWQWADCKRESDGLCISAAGGPQEAQSEEARLTLSTEECDR
mmetsp:Transcript_70711/g.188090  ORF Transcript_70711/g.188090 Transcript_70711/m.188090 type:complete len:125 (+) Transcript_70711:119-493(+)